MVNKCLGLVICCLLVLTGCGSGGGSPIRYYLIDPVEQDSVGGISDAAGNRGMKIQILNLHIPQYLERFQLASRSGTNQLVFSDNHQWGENLRKNLLRTTSRNLSNLLSTADVGTPISRSSTKPQFRVMISIEQFDQGSDGKVVLSGRYQIAKGATNEVLITRSFNMISTKNSSGNYSKMVASMQTLLNEFCIDVAKTIVKLGQES